MKIISLMLALLLGSLLTIGGAIPAANAGNQMAGKAACETEQTSGVAAAACGRCGDGFCAVQCGETAKNCPKDCGVVESVLLACGKCGDGRCTPQCGETATSCPKDCGVESQRAVVRLSLPGR